MAATKTNLKEVYDSAKNDIHTVFLSFKEFSQSDENRLLRRLHNIVDRHIWFTVEMMSPIYEELAEKLTRDKGTDISPLMIKERLMIMQTRCQLFNRYYKVPGVRLKKKKGKVTINRNLHDLHVKFPPMIDMLFKEKGFKNYTKMQYLFVVKELPIPQIKVLSKMDVLSGNP